MKSARTDLLASTLLGLLFAVLLATPVTAQQKQAPTMPFQLTSSEFSSDSTLPISMILNVVQNGVNLCSIDGSMGRDQSPELSWSNAPEHTQSYVVVTYDDTAAFTHWGMYNIPGTATGLPANAGVAGSTYGSQIANDFYAAEYDGPCPPPGVAPTVHHYVFTVYALDTTLSLPGSPNFAPNAETLYHALISAGRFHHILATARLVGLYSTTPAK